MAFIYVSLTEIKRTIDEKTGELTNLHVAFKELSPRSGNIKILGKSTETLQAIFDAVEQKYPVMLPVREGTTSDGGSYISLQEGDIMPIAQEFLRKKQLEEFNRLKRLLFPEKDSANGAGTVATSGIGTTTGVTDGKVATATAGTTK